MPLASQTFVTKSSSFHLLRPGRTLACLFAIVFLWVAAPAFGVTIAGKVFHDRNGNGMFDPREPGLARVAVSDGHQVVVTSKNGYYELATEAGRLVFVSLPTGYRSAHNFYVRVESQTSVSFPLVAWPESRKNAVRFVQITDTHVTDSAETGRTFGEDIAEINSLAPAAVFALATGDLVNIGRKTNEYEGYLRGIAHFEIPLFNLPGNHDAKTEEGLAHYHHYLGPDYYSFNVGKCHFVMLNSMRFNEEIQKQWIAQDLAAAPKGVTRIFAFHFLPTQKQIEYLAKLGAAAVLSGHWHGNRVRESQGVLDINTPPLRFGGIDRHPRSFRIVDVNRGKLDVELRLGGFKQHCVVVSPCGTVRSEAREIPVVVNTYDSRYEIEDVYCEIARRHVPLKQASPWTWIGAIKAKGLVGPQSLTAHVRAKDGEEWTQVTEFNVQPTESRASAGTSLPLKWVAPTGGFIGISSPRAGRNCIAVGVDDKGDLKNCGVAAFDRNGKKLWHFKTDSGIKNNIAAANGRLFATSVAGWLYALNESSGKLLWKAELDRKRERWEVAATTAADGVVYVGRHSYIAAFDEKTGKRLWEASEGKSDWWPSSYTIPTVFDGKLLLFTRQEAVALNASTGQRAWKAEGQFNGCLATNGIAYTLRNDSLAALSLTDGTVLWSRTNQVGDTASVPAMSSDKIVVGTAKGDITAFSEQDGLILWTFETGSSLSSLQPYKRGERDVNSSPAIFGDKVFAGASDGVVYAVSLASGEKVGSYQLGVPIASSPLIHDGTLYIGGYDGNLYAFKVD